MILFLFIARLRIGFDTSQLAAGDQDLGFAISVRSNSQELDEADNAEFFHQRLSTQADLGMVGGFRRSEKKFSQTFQVKFGAFSNIPLCVVTAWRRTKEIDLLENIFLSITHKCKAEGYSKTIART